jgi:surfactin family lipopeptide synthetase A
MEPTLQSKIRLVWEEVLGVREIGDDDNFFDLGGHSFLVLDVVDRIETELGVALPLREFFSNPTLREVAEATQARLNAA